MNSVFNKVFIAATFNVRKKLESFRVVFLEIIKPLF